MNADHICVHLRNLRQADWINNNPISWTLEQSHHHQLLSTLESDIQPARLQCAILPLQALREGLKNYHRPE